MEFSTVVTLGDVVTLLGLLGGVFLFALRYERRLTAVEVSLEVHMKNVERELGVFLELVKTMVDGKH